MTNNPTTGWTDWSSTPKQNQSQKLEDRIAELEKKFRTHQGIDFAAAGIDYPHPSQRVRALYFFEGQGRLDPSGIEITAPIDAGEVTGISWQPQFTIDPTVPVFPKSQVLGATDEDPAGEYYSLLALQSRSEQVSSLARIKIESQTEGFEAGDAIDSVELRAGALFVTVGAIATILFNRTTSERYLTLDNCPLWLSVETSDFATLQDGELWYRSDLDRFRARANGTTENLAYESDIPTSMNVQPFAAKTTTYTTTNADGVISVDATSASFTVTLVTASGNAGLTQTFKKINAANVVTLDANGSQTIDGVASYALSARWSWVSVISNGANWLITGAG